MKLLAELKATVEEGVETQQLQREPHLILLSRPFYTERLRPVLAQWLLQFIRMQRQRQLDDKAVLAYLLRRQKPANGALDRATDETMKLLNISHDWLNLYLPHVLTRTSRVHYGLLQPEQLAEALEETPGMPKNRRFLAVPFVGKDVPSKASEFSQPDIVIGLTILAYRYEGLRRSDVVCVLRALREQMALESGPHAKRPACLLWVKWVELAGKRVRGTQRSPATEIERLKAATLLQAIGRRQQARRRFRMAREQLRTRWNVERVVSVLGGLGLGSGSGSGLGFDGASKELCRCSVGLG